MGSCTVGEAVSACVLIAPTVLVIGTLIYWWWDWHHPKPDKRYEMTRVDTLEAFYERTVGQKPRYDAFGKLVDNNNA